MEANVAVAEAITAPPEEPQTDTPIAPVAIRFQWIMPAIVALAGVVRLYNLGGPSLMIDEVTSHRIATAPWDAMWRVILTRETNRGLYYAFLRPWIAIFGGSEAALRMPNVLSSGRL